MTDRPAQLGISNRAECHLSNYVQVKLTRPLELTKACSETQLYAEVTDH